MPDLPALLAEEADRRRPDAAPPFGALLARRRRRLVRRAVAGSVLAAVAVAGVPALLPGPPAPPPLAASAPGVEERGVTAVRTTPSGLLVSYTGGACDGPVSTRVRETAAAVELVVETRVASDSCVDIGISRTVEVDLQQPLDDRPVRTGRQVLRAFDGARLLTPSALPPGYALRGESGSAREDGVVREWQRTYGEPERPPTASGACGPGPAPLQLLQGPPGHQPWAPDQWTPDGTVDVGGATAQVLVGRYAPDGSELGLALVWPAAGGTVSLASQVGCRGDVVADRDELVALARGLEQRG